MKKLIVFAITVLFALTIHAADNGIMIIPEGSTEKIPYDVYWSLTERGVAKSSSGNCTGVLEQNCTRDIPANGRILIPFDSHHKWVKKWNISGNNHDMTIEVWPRFGTHRRDVEYYMNTEPPSYVPIHRSEETLYDGVLANGSIFHVNLVSERHFYDSYLVFVNNTGSVISLHYTMNATHPAVNAELVGEIRMLSFDIPANVTTEIDLSFVPTLPDFSQAQWYDDTLDDELLRPLRVFVPGLSATFNDSDTRRLGADVIEVFTYSPYGTWDEFDPSTLVNGWLPLERDATTTIRIRFPMSLKPYSIAVLLQDYLSKDNAPTNVYGTIVWSE